MKKQSLIICFCCFLTARHADAQPFIDIARVNYSYTPQNGFNKKKEPLSSHIYSINATLPIELKKDGDAIVINPFFDHNQGSIDHRSFNVVSQGLALGFLKKTANKKWSLFTNFILRRNKQTGKQVNDCWQYGGIAMTTWNKRPGLSIRVGGVYYNRESFGNFFIPLAGIDWKIDSRNNLFGVLPGNLTFEHRINKSFYWGSVFRAMTNSYRMETIDPCFGGDCSGKNYLRIDDNQLGLFADTYLTSNIVITAEAGYTIFRRYRFGFRGNSSHHYSDLKSDNFYFRLQLAFRYRR